MSAELFGLNEWDDSLNKDPEKAHEPFIEAGANCKQCPLYAKKQGPVPNELRSGSLALVAEAPGANEVAQGAPMVGKSGYEMGKILEKVGLSRQQSGVSVLNAMACRHSSPQSFQPWADRERRKAKSEGREWHDPRDCCRPILKKDLERIKPEVIVTLGKHGMEAVAAIAEVPVGKNKKDKPGAKALAEYGTQQGFPFTFENEYPAKTLIPTVHPAFAMRKHAEYFEQIYKVVKHAQHLIDHQNGHVQMHPPGRICCYIPDPSTHEYFDDPDFTFESVCPDWFYYTSSEEQFLDWFHEFRDAINNSPKKVFLTCDIEASGVEWDSFLRVVGLHAVIDGVEWVCILPFRHYRGRDILGKETREYLEDQLRKLFVGGKVLPAFHNGMFDTRHLRRDGIWPKWDLKWHDTLNMQKNSYHCDMPRRLDAVTADRWDSFEYRDENGYKVAVNGTGDLYLWKGDVDHKAGGGSASDRMTEELFLGLLTLYNFFDMIAQGRVARPLIAEVKHAGCWPQYSRERSFAPKLQKMGELGVPQSIEKACEFRKTIEDKIQLTLDTVPKIVAEIEKEVGKTFKVASKTKKNYKPLGNNKDDKKRKRIVELQSRFKQPVRDRVGVWGDTFNLASDRQVADLLYDFCGLDPILAGSGDPWEEGDTLSVSKGALFALEENGVTPNVKKLITAKVLLGSLRTNLNTFVSRAQFGRYHPAFLNETHTWLQTTYRDDTVTGRKTTKPNLQNYPKMGFINARLMLVPPPGHVFVACDWDQLELRLVTIASDDQAYKEAFARNLDAHTYGMATMLAPQENREVEEFYQELMQHLDEGWVKADPETRKKIHRQVKDQRSSFKMIVFSLFYGAMPLTVYQQVINWTRKDTGTRLFPHLVGKPEQVEQIYNDFIAAHPSLPAWHAEIDAFVAQYGYIESIVNKRRRQFAYGVNDKNAPRNHRIQATAGDLADNKLKEMIDAIPFGCWSPYTGAVIQCHDEFVFCVPREKALRAAQIMREIMNFKLSGVPITGDPEITEAYAGKPIPFEQFAA